MEGFCIGRGIAVAEGFARGSVFSLEVEHDSEGPAVMHARLAGDDFLRIIEENPQSLGGRFLTGCEGDPHGVVGIGRHFHKQRGLRAVEGSVATQISAVAECGEFPQDRAHGFFADDSAGVAQESGGAFGVEPRVGANFQAHIRGGIAGEAVDEFKIARGGPAAIGTAESLHHADSHTRRRVAREIIENRGMKPVGLVETGEDFGVDVVLVGKIERGRQLLAHAEDHLLELGVAALDQTAPQGDIGILVAKRGAADAEGLGVVDAV